MSQGKKICSAYNFCMDLNMANKNVCVSYLSFPGIGLLLLSRCLLVLQDKNCIRQVCKILFRRSIYVLRETDTLTESTSYLGVGEYDEVTWTQRGVFLSSKEVQYKCRPLELMFSPLTFGRGKEHLFSKDEITSFYSPPPHRPTPS